MEGSNYSRYGYKTQHSYPRSQVITWRRPEVKFDRNVVRENNNKKKPTKIRTKKFRNKINTQILCQFDVLYSGLFNGISNSMGYLIPKQSYWKNSSGSI